MKRKTAILTVSYLVSAIFMLGLFASLQKAAAADAVRYDRYQGEMAFEELCAAAQSLGVALEKAVLTTSPSLTASLSAEASAEAGKALIALGTLTFPSQELEQTARYLGVTADYTSCVTRMASSGAALPEEDRENLRQLAEVAGWLSKRLQETRGAIADGLADSDGTPRALHELEAALPDFPNLTYDGCYTYDDSEPAMLAGKSETSEREACLIAAAFLGQRSGAAVSEGKSECKLPCWRVTVGEYAVSVSARGGQVLQAMCERGVGETVLSVDTARAETEKFLQSRGYTHMHETAWRVENGLLVTTWCYEQNGVHCYPDRIHMALALDTGALAGFDATDYVENHRWRALERSYISAEDARAFVPAELEVQEESLAVIASPGGEEKLCWSFLCRRESGERCVVFCSAATGAQERIALLREDESGVKSV